MNQYNFVTTIEAETLQQAMEVMAQRLGHDEDYGFPYTVDWMFALLQVEDKTKSIDEENDGEL